MTTHSTHLRSWKDSAATPLLTQTKHFLHEVPTNGPDLPRLWFCHNTLWVLSVQGLEGVGRSWELYASPVDSREPAQFVAMLPWGSFSKEIFAGECSLWSASQGTGKAFASHATPPILPTPAAL